MAKVVLFSGITQWMKWVATLTLISYVRRIENKVTIEKQASFYKKKKSSFLEVSFFSYDNITSRFVLISKQEKQDLKQSTTFLFFSERKVSSIPSTTILKCISHANRKWNSDNINKIISFFEVFSRQYLSTLSIKCLMLNWWPC